MSRRICEACGKRRPTYQRANGARAGDKEHTLCRQCWETQRDSNVARLAPPKEREAMVMRYEDIPAMNYSRLKAMEESPRNFAWWEDKERPDSSSYRVGRGTHCRYLEAEQYEARYGEFPGKVRRGKAWEEWKAAHPDVESLTTAERETVRLCANALGEHAEASRLLSGGKAEQVITWTDAATGTQCKSRLDYVTPLWLADLKTTSRKLTKFHLDVADYLYHGQIAYYFDGAVEAKVLPPDAAAYFVVVQTVPPYDVKCFRVPDFWMQAGRWLYRHLLDLWCECSAADLWPGCAPSIEDLEPVAYAPGMREINEEVWL